jgi:hypothetical protein
MYAGSNENEMQRSPIPCSWLHSKCCPGLPRSSEPRDHQLATCTGAVLKAPRRDNRNVEIRMLLFEGAIAWSRSAEHFGHAPAVAPPEFPPDEPMPRVRSDFTNGRGPKFDRNFRQEFLLLKSYKR